MNGMDGMLNGAEEPASRIAAAAILNSKRRTYDYKRIIQLI